MNNNLLTLAKRAARDAGRIILEALDQPRDPDFKGQADLVTETDRQAEELSLIHI